MKQGHYQIATPCHEDWTTMTPVEQGRFCDSCSKCVVDLREKSQAEIRDLFIEYEGNMCGHMRISQLARPLPDTSVQPGPIRKALTKLQIFALALFAAFSMAFSSGAQAQSTESVPIEHIEMLGDVMYVPAEGSVEGSVTWQYGGVAAGVEVKLMRSKQVYQRTLTDKQGHYAFEDIETGEYQLVVSEHGFELTSAHVLSDGRTPISRNLVLRDMEVDGGIGYIEMPELPNPEPEVPVERAVEPIEAIPVVVKSQTRTCNWPPYTLPLIDVKTLSNSKPAIMEKSAEAIPDRSLKAAAFPDALFAYPNPTADKIHLSSESRSALPFEVYVLDLNGKVLYEGYWLRVLHPEMEIDLGRFANGTYILKLVNEEAAYEKRIVKVAE